MASPKTQIRASFPALAPANFKVTSDKDDDYNCIGFAAEETNRFWWPVKQPPYYWPPDLPLDLTVENFVAAFEKLGYSKCENFGLEEEYEKVVIYANAKGVPTHVARQLADGRWTCKLGRSWDIEHKTLAGLAGKEYGSPTQAMKRAKPEPPVPAAAPP